MNNLERLIQLAIDVFDAKADPDQLDVNEDVIEHLREIDPNSVSEERNENGPIAWVLVIPTTKVLMNKFLRKEISEKQLYQQTLPGENYDVLYLCSALVLEEHQRKGVAQKLTVRAINNIKQKHTLEAIFVWTFTNEGEKSAEKIASLAGLPLYKRN